MKRDPDYEKIIKWFFNTKDEFLNLVSHPFYDLELIVEFLNSVVKFGSRVLYITHDETYIKHKLRMDNLNYDNLVFSTPFSSFDGAVKFDLVIFDDISGISVIDDNSIMMYLRKMNSRKKIVMSMREIIKGPEIYAVNRGAIRFKEPRSIQTKIDLNYDIPNVVFKFLEWFFESESKVILITKDNGSAENVHRYMKKYLSISPKLRNLFIDSDFESFYDFEIKTNLNSYIYVTPIDFMGQFHRFILSTPIKVQNFNIVVFFASDKVFNYKNLLNLCGISNFLRDCKNEVIFVSNHENIEIIMAKRISRSYNERIWEFRLKN